MRALRLCILTPAFPPAEGGQEAYALELARALAAQGVAVQVLTKRLKSEHPRGETFGAVRVRRLGPVGDLKALGWRGMLPIAFFLANTTWQLLWEARRYDVVLVSGFNLLPLAAVAVRTLTRKPCIVRPESPLEMQSAVGSESLSKMRLSQGSLLLRTLMGLRHRAAVRVDRYIAISSEIRAALEQAGVPRQAITAIPNGIDTQRFAPVDAPRRRELRQRLGLPAEGLVLLYTGRLAVSKGVLMLAEVWQELAPHYPSAHLVLIGTGRSSHDDCEAELRRFLESSSLGARTTLPGNVDQVEWYLQAADVFVFPSDSEGFGLSILEAMAVGLPMVSTRVGVAAEFPDEDGVALLVPPRDRTAFAGALRQLLDDPPLREALARRAQGAVRAQYSMDAVARRHIELCIEAVGGATISAPPARQAREN